MKKIIIKNTLLCFFAISLQAVAQAAELQYNFNSPTFNGNGYGTYELSIRQMQEQNTANYQAQQQAIQQAAQTAAANTPQAQFVANLQSRVYSQLALNITNTLFGATGQPSCGNNCGGTMDVGGNTITWSLNNANQTINIRIVNDSNTSQYTNMTVPVGTFAF
jgi:hypothetical protein